MVKRVVIETTEHGKKWRISRAVAAKWGSDPSYPGTSAHLVHLGPFPMHVHLRVDVYTEGHWSQIGEGVEERDMDMDMDREISMEMEMEQWVRQAVTVSMF